MEDHIIFRQDHLKNLLNNSIEVLVWYNKIRNAAAFFTIIQLSLNLCRKMIDPIKKKTDGSARWKGAFRNLS